MDKRPDIGRIINNVARTAASSGTSMCRRFFQVDSFVKRTCVTLATGVSGHESDRTGKDKETLKTVLVEKPESVNREVESRV